MKERLLMLLMAGMLLLSAGRVSGSLPQMVGNGPPVQLSDCQGGGQCQL